MILVRVGIYDVIQGDYLFCKKKWPYHGPACVEVASIKTTSVYEKPYGMRRFDQKRIPIITLFRLNLWWGCSEKRKCSGLISEHFLDNYLSSRSHFTCPLRPIIALVSVVFPLKRLQIAQGV